MTSFILVYASRKRKKIKCALVDLQYMDGACLHVGTSRKEKW